MVFPSAQYEETIMTKSCHGAAAAALASVAFGFFPLPASAAGICDQTTIAASIACDLDATSGYNIALGNCINLGSSSAMHECRSQAAKSFAQAKKLCVAQAPAREKVCDAIGQAAYDPKINPADFSTVIDNPLFPLKPGDVHVYKNGASRITVTVTSDTIELAGVTCIVVHDTNKVDGKIEEDTLDYYAQHKDGSVWYFGEDTISYEDGVASTHGSWRAGLNGAKPGIVMLAHPVLGKTYRQEFFLGEAEDVAKSIAINQKVVVPAGTYNNAFETKDFTPITPGNVENKYYVPGIGGVLVVNPATGEREELVRFTPGL